MRKKLISTIILVVVFSLCLQLPVLAVSPSPNGLTNEHYQQIYSQLDTIYTASPLSSHSDFSSLKIGTPIPVYSYINNILTPENYTIYPIFSSSGVPFLALKITLDNGTSIMQVTSNSLDDLTRFINNDIALIYDSAKRHIISNDSIISSTEFVDPEPGVPLTNVSLARLLNSHSISYKTANTVYPLNYSVPTVNTRDPYITLAVPTKYQTYSNICWAACVASITQYLTGANHTAIQVASSVAGTSVVATYNATKDLTEIIAILRSFSGQSYFSHSVAPTQQRIYDNLVGGYPLIGGVTNVSTYSNHAVVIRGIYMDSHILLMDPYSGYVSAYLSSGGFRYTNPDNNKTFALTSYAAKIY